MTNLGGTFQLGSLPVHRMGFGAMRLSGPGIYGPPADPAEAARILHAAIDAGVDHIDTSDFYGPHLTNQLIRDTLHPYRDTLVLVTKVGARRNPNAAWLPALSPDQIRSAVEDNLRNLALDVLPVVNLRMGSGKPAPFAAPVTPQFETLLDLQRQGKILHIGLSNIVPSQLDEALSLGPVVCVQNNYGILNRTDDELLETCAGLGIAFVPFFPLGGFQPWKSAAMDTLAAELSASPMQLALAWLLHGPENILLIPGTSSLAHLQENLAAASLTLTADQLRQLDALA